MTSLSRIAVAAGLALLLVAGIRTVTTEWFGVVTTRGASMEPVYQQGDLVLTRRAQSYEVGDIVAYRSGALADEVVLHRIIDIDDGRAITQGDNNDWVDGDRPELDALEGRAVLHVPRLGALLTGSRPLLAAGAVGLMAVGLGTGRRRRRPRHLRSRRTETAPMRRRETHYATVRHVLRAAGVLGACAAATLALTVVRDAQEAVSAPLRFTHQGSFDYHAPVSSRIVYPDGSVDTGEPIYRRLTDRLSVGFTYEPPTDVDLDAAGTAHLELDVSNGSWQRTVEVGDPSRLLNGGTEIEIDVDLGELEGLVASVAKETGEPASPFDVIVRPVVDVRGDVAGTEIDDTFSPELHLQVDALRVAVDDAQLEPSREASVAVSTSVERPLVAGPLSVPVDVARRLGIIGVALAIIAAVGAAAARRRISAGESLRVRAQHRDQILSVNAVPVRDQVVEVTSVRSLLKLAERYDRFVLHEDREEGDWFIVDDGHTTFRYRAGA